MGYDNFEMYEVINEILRENNVKMLSVALGKTPYMLYKYGQNPDNSGTDIPSRLIIPFSKATSDRRLIEFLAHHIGMKLTPRQKGPESNGTLVNEFLALCEGVGRLSAEVKHDLEDGKIDDVERKRMNKLLLNLKKEIEIMECLLEQ